MSRRRERANYDGSVSLVRPDRTDRLHLDADADPEIMLIRLAKIIDILNEAALGVLKQDLHYQRDVTARNSNYVGKLAPFSFIDARQQELEAKSRPFRTSGVADDQEILSITARLSNHECYGYWSDAASVCERWVAEGTRYADAENIAGLWREAVHAFDRILNAHGPKFPFGAVLNVSVLMKIRAIEPLVLQLLARTNWDQEIPDSECVTQELRAKAKKVVAKRNKKRMEELHTPDLASLIAAQSVLTTVVIITIFCATAFLGVAWTYSASEIGNHHDMDFWFIVQSSAMALLGYFTAIFPLYQRSWGSPWQWSLGFCVVGATSSLVAIPAFLLAPPFWSSALLFFGTVSQAVMTLQLSLLAMQPGSRKKQD